MITVRYGAASRRVTIKGTTVDRNDLSKKQDDKLIRLVKFMLFEKS